MGGVAWKEDWGDSVQEIGQRDLELRERTGEFPSPAVWIEDRVVLSLYSIAFLLIVINLILGLSRQFLNITMSCAKVLLGSNC